LESKGNISTLSTSPESIDFNKLNTIIRKNWIWIASIFIIINAVAHLYIRYTKNIYESDSQLKLDIKSNATEFGITNIVEDQSPKMVSGEIELIQSRLFLNQVLDHYDLEVSFFSVGRFLNDELFGNVPAFITYRNRSHSLYNIAIKYNEVNPVHFTLQAGEGGPTVEGMYGEKVRLLDLEVTLHRNIHFKKGDEIGYFFIINSREALLEYLISNLTAEPLNYNANTIRIAFKDYNSFKAQTILSQIDTLYLKYSNEQKNLATKQKIDWITNELRHIEKRMEGYEDYFEDFTVKNKTNDLNEDLKRIITNIYKIDSQRYELSRKIKESELLTKNLNTADYSPSILIRQSLPPALVENFEQLQLLQLEMNRLKLSYNEITFAYRQKQKELETLKRKITRDIAELNTEWLRQLKELDKRKDYLESEFITIPDKNTEFSKNQRFYKLYEEFYLSLMQSKSEFEIAQAGSISDFRILSPASLPTTPISPKKVMIMGIGFVMSLVINIFFIGILYLLNNKITSLHEIERLSSAPVLGAIPTLRYTNSGALYVLEHPKSMVSEAIRTLRTNLDFFNINEQKKVIAISSTVSGEGKSFIAMNLGGVIASSKKKVVLLDLDMRKSKTNLPFPLKDLSKGVSTILIRKHAWHECVIKTSIENFDFIPSGPHPPNPSELLLNGEFSEFLETLKKEYDFIILDTPPVGIVTDGIMAMKRADISIYVFRANYSKKDFLVTLQRIINIHKFANITTLLNGVSIHRERYGYGYYEEHEPSKMKSFFKF
jgi:tyrosine-protein kinase Etk/Wzc